MRRIWVATLLCLLLAPASANAWWIGGTAQLVTVHADPGEVNTFTVAPRADPPATDSTATFRGTFCSPASSTHGCWSLPTRVGVDAGDQDDSITICCASEDDYGGWNSVDPGSGRDTVVIKSTSDLYVEAVDGEVDTITCPENDLNIIVNADDDDVTHGCHIVVRRNGRPPITATVTTTADDYDSVCDTSCSVRDAVYAVSANGDGTVVIPAGTFVLDEPLLIPRGMTIRGAGAKATVIRGWLTAHAEGARFGTAGEIAVSDLTVQSDAPLAAHGKLTVERVRLLRTDGYNSTGISSNGDLVVRDSLISGFERGIDSSYCSLAACLSVENSTIAFDGGGLGLKPPALIAAPTVAQQCCATWIVGTPQLTHVTLTTPGTAIIGAAALRASIVVGDCARIDQPDLRDRVVSSLGGNVVTTAACAADSVADPQLGALADNGGPTETRAPGSASPARDRATCVLATDQRGAPRPAGPACDSGAVELAAPAVPRQPLGVADRVKPFLRSIKVSLRRGTYLRLRTLAVRFTLSEPARIKLALRHSKTGGVLRSTSADLGAGAHKLAVGRKLLRTSLRKRRYVVTITATDAAGNRSATYSLNIRLR